MKPIEPLNALGGKSFRAAHRAKDSKGRCPLARAWAGVRPGAGVWGCQSLELSGIYAPIGPFIVNRCFDLRLHSLHSTWPVRKFGI